MEQQPQSEPTPESKQFEEGFRTAVQDILQFYPDSDALLPLRPETLMEDYSDLDEIKRQIMKDVILQETDVNPLDPETIVQTYNFEGKDSNGEPIKANAQVFDIKTTNQEKAAIIIRCGNTILEQSTHSGYLHIITYDTGDTEYCIGGLGVQFSSQS